MKAPVVYLAGAIEACKNKKDTHGWRAEAEKRLKELGFLVLCPICDGIGDLYGKKLTTKQIQAIVREDLEMVESSNYVLVNGTLRSEGTAMEIYAAYHNNKRSTVIVTFGLGEDQRTFVRYHSTHIVGDLDDAIIALQGLEREREAEYGS